MTLPVVDHVPVSALLAAPVSHFIDFHTVTKQELQGIQIPLQFTCSKPGLVDAIACWFDVTFDGSDPNVTV